MRPGEMQEMLDRYKWIAVHVESVFGEIDEVMEGDRARSWVR
jgi:hypothetical protein